VGHPAAAPDVGVGGGNAAERSGLQGPSWSPEAAASWVVGGAISSRDGSTLPSTLIPIPSPAAFSVAVSEAARSVDSTKRVKKTQWAAHGPHAHPYWAQRAIGSSLSFTTSTPNGPLPASSRKQESSQRLAQRGPFPSLSFLFFAKISELNLYAKSSNKKN
jgi:hypothetical protein